MADGYEERRQQWHEAGGAGLDEVPALGSIVHDTAMAYRPGRVRDWDGAETLVLEPLGGGETWTTQLVAARGTGPRRVVAVQAAEVSLDPLLLLDCSPLSLEVLGEVLTITQQVVDGEVRVGGSTGHSILTATDAVRDRQLTGHFRAGIPRIDDLVRLQMAQAVCAVLYPQVPVEAVTAVLRWQRDVINDPGALSRVIGLAADRVGLAANVARAEVRQATAGTIDVDGARL